MYCPVKPVVFCTDSQVVLHYLSNLDIPLLKYERIRVEKVLEYTSIQQWMHVPTDENAADQLTKVKGVLCKTG